MAKMRDLFYSAMGNFPAHSVCKKINAAVASKTDPPWLTDYWSSHFTDVRQAISIEQLKHPALGWVRSAVDDMFKWDEVWKLMCLCDKVR